MKFVGLVSGGKDSCYAMHLTAAAGNELVAIANLKPSQSGELDSYMYQTVGQDVIDLYSEALGVPLYQRVIEGKPINQEMDYNQSVDGDEVEDLFILLKEMKEKLDFEAVCCGAIHSNYQRIRAENVGERLGLKILSPLWGREQSILLKEMIDAGIDAILIKVAVMGLVPEKHLTKTIGQMYEELVLLKKRYGINVCGEGGEYETLTLNCPLFKKRIVIDNYEIIQHSNDAFAPVAYVQPIKMHLESK